MLALKMAAVVALAELPDAAVEGNKAIPGL